MGITEIRSLTKYGSSSDRYLVSNHKVQEIRQEQTFHIENVAVKQSVRIK
jgi:hypothetical protein